MATLIKDVCAVVLLVMVVVALAPHADAALNCGRVTSLLVPCAGYLKNGGRVPRTCCKGVRTLVAAARTTSDRRTACYCLKGAYGGFPGIKVPNAQSLPSRCGAKVPYKISPNTDCSR